MKKKLVKAKKKKGWTLKEKIIASVSVFAIVTSWTTVAGAAALSWSSPNTNFNIENSSTGSVDGSSSSDGAPFSCCGDNAKTYSGCENSFISSSTIAFCKPPAKISIFPKVVNFPELGQQVNWNCFCKNADGTPLIGPDGQPIISSCWAKRESALEISACGENSPTTFLGTYPGSGLPAGITYCAKGEPNFIYGDTRVYPDDESDGCFMIAYLCSSCDRIVERSCFLRFCDKKKVMPRRFCQDGWLDLDLGEECEYPLGITAFLGKTCANSSAKGACGRLKCTVGCKIDDSDCHPCSRSENGGVEMN